MKLPIGIQTLSEIRERGMLYVDKTERIHRIVTGGKYFFLSRPRRFGKSLLLSTMREMYEGNQKLFEGLWIYNNWDWQKTFPVIHVKFAKFGYQHDNLEQAIDNGIQLEAERLGIVLNGKIYKSNFEELIVKAAEQSSAGKVVVLIDEYDKPIIDYLDDLPQAKTNRQILKSFYSVLKDSDPYLELVFITGVSRFSKTSIFSELNNLNNLTLHPKAATLLGITQEELDIHFSGAMDHLAKEKDITTAIHREQIRFWYNGYSWNGTDKLYNPFSLFSYFDAREFHNFWFETGTPTFLVKALREKYYYDIEQLEVSDAVLDSYELENLNTITILFQAGYLTIQQKIAQGIYELAYPNREVQISLEERLLNAFAYDSLGSGKVRALNMARALKKENVAELIEIINATFSSVPYQLWQKENEAFYHALIHLTFSLMGAFIQSEVNSAGGRLDAKVETDDTIYILEFKLDQSAESALQQIADRGYFDTYLQTDKKRIGIGINFSKEHKRVERWLVKEF